nr:alpha-2-HS-glycoprotein [Pogona vitticeps]
MRSLIALVLLGQILGCTAVSPPFIPLRPQLLPCDLPEVEHAAEIAVNHINTHTVHGYKYVLNRIEKAKMIPRRPHGEIYFLEMELLETRCHVLSPVPAANCSVRARHEHAVEGDCNVKLLKHEGEFKVLNVHCHSTPDSAEDVVRLCPDCPLLLPLNNANVVSAVNTALAHFNAENNSIHYQLLEISRGQISVLPPATHVEFAIVLSNCSAQEAQDLAQDCKPLTGEHSQFGFCKATVFDHNVPTGQTLPKDVVHCSVYEQQAGAFHTHWTEHHLGGKIISPGIGHTVLSLIHSHNDTHASHESHSAEAIVPAVQPAVVKREVGAAPPLQPVLVAPGPQLCPGKVHFFSLD